MHHAASTHRDQTKTCFTHRTSNGSKCRMEWWHGTGENTCWNATEGRSATEEEFNETQHAFENQPK